MKPCTWNGKPYPSRTACAFDLGVSVATLINRMRAGHNSDATIRHLRRCTWNGVDYRSVRQASIGSGITEVVLTRYLDRHYYCDEDVLRVKWQGKRYKNVTQAAKEVGVSYDTMCQLLTYGTKEIGRVAVRINGNEYESLSEAGRTYGYSRERIRQVVAQHGEDLNYYPDGKYNQETGKKRKWESA